MYAWNARQRCVYACLAQGMDDTWADLLRKYHDDMTLNGAIPAMEAALEVAKRYDELGQVDGGSAEETAQIRMRRECIRAIQINIPEVLEAHRALAKNLPGVAAAAGFGDILSPGVGHAPPGSLDGRPAPRQVVLCVRGSYLPGRPCPY